MALNLYNTLTRTKERFEPLVPGQVGMYACGPTVYDYFHIGNARAFIVFDTLRRVLERRGHAVRYVQNITDVDDKIINRARQEGREPQALAAEFTEAFFTDLAALGCRPADVAPKATEHIVDIMDLVNRLVDGGHAYVLDGDVYFSVRSFAGYGKLSGKNIQELESGARVEVDARKQDPLDFALWKAAKPGEPFWDSPWGPGRPGWHIECSAMSMKYLGERFDIHGGGEDLIFPHHENENAQSESVTGKTLARFWLHNGYLNINGEKMSKSLGNFKVVRDILRTVPPQVLRLFMLSAHYRSPLDFSPDNLAAAEAGYGELRRTLERLAALTARVFPDDYLWDETAESLDRERKEAKNRFEQALDDDLNTAGALGHVFHLANQVRRTIAARPKPTTRLFRTLSDILVDLRDLTDVLGVQPIVTPVPEEIEDLKRQRDEARGRKDWAESDRLRDEAARLGYQLEDTVFGALITTAPPPAAVETP